jgi:hypothetical protein
MQREASPAVSRWTLRLDGLFLICAGSAALVAETVGHFFGVGPLAATLGSPHTIGGFEAHALAIIIAVLLFRGAALADRQPWHVLGLSVHLVLGGANILFWSSFVQQDLLAVGFVTTALHAVFVVAHVFCLTRGKLS